MKEVTAKLGEDIATFAARLIDERDTSGDIVFGRFSGVRLEADADSTPESIVRFYAQQIRMDVNEALFASQAERRAAGILNRLRELDFSEPHSIRDELFALFQRFSELELDDPIFYEYVLMMLKIMKDRGVNTSLQPRKFADDIDRAH